MQPYANCYNVESAEGWPIDQPNPNGELTRAYVRLSGYVNAIAVVLVPTLGVVVFNSILVWTLHKR